MFSSLNNIIIISKPYRQGFILFFTSWQILAQYILILADRNFWQFCLCIIKQEVLLLHSSAAWYLPVYINSILLKIYSFLLSDCGRDSRNCSLCSFYSNQKIHLCFYTMIPPPTKLKFPELPPRGNIYIRKNLISIIGLTFFPFVR